MGIPGYISGIGTFCRDNSRPQVGFRKEPSLKQPTTETVVGGPPVVEYFWVFFKEWIYIARQPEEANTAVKVYYTCTVLYELPSITRFIFIIKYEIDSSTLLNRLSLYM